MRQRDTDMLLRGWLDAAAPAAAPNGLLDSTLARTGASRSRPGWVAGLIGEALPDTRHTTRRQLLAFAVAAAVVAAMAVIGVQLANFARVGQSNPTLAPTPGPIDWRGPVPRVRGEAAMIPLLPFLEGAGSPALTGPPVVSQPWIDITSVSVHGGQLQWNIQLAESPPKASGLDPNETLIAYGLVVETTGDDVADYVIGISNETPTPGDFRVWVTNLVTGDTNEKVGGPYGVPVEFSHPDETQPATLPPSNQMVFTFLPGTRPSGVSAGDRYYAWASQTSGTEVIAWDYEPANGWPTAPAASVPVMDVAYGWPDTTHNSPGVYSWDGSQCGRLPSVGPDSCNIGFMHNGYGSGDVEIRFGVLPGGLAAGEAVTIAGRDGTYRRDTDQQEVWAVDIEGTTMAFYVSARPGTSETDLAEAHAIIDSIRAEPQDNDRGFRLVFTLETDDWDSG